MEATKRLRCSSEEYLESSFFQVALNDTLYDAPSRALEDGYNRAINICSDAENCAPHPGYPICNGRQPVTSF
jgi:hypothetical protein